MSELTGQLRMEMSTAEPTADMTDYYDNDGNLLPEPRGARLDAIAVEINMLEASAKDTFRRTAMEIGKRLTEAQNLVPRGRWGEWLEKNVRYSTRKAQQLMEVYGAYAGKALPEAYEALSFTQIYDLLQAPEDQRDELAERAAGEGMSTRALKAEIDRLKAQQQEDNRKIYDLIQAGEEKDRTIEQQQKDLEEERLRADGASGEAFRAEATAKDAVKRANESDRALTEAKKRIEALEARSPEVVETVPEAMTREIEELKRELQSARANAADERSKAVLAMNLQARIAIADIKAKAAEARRAIEKLKVLEPEQAAARLAELKQAGGEIADVGI